MGMLLSACFHSVPTFQVSQSLKASARRPHWIVLSPRSCRARAAMAEVRVTHRPANLEMTN